MTLHGKDKTLICLVLAGLAWACVKKRAQQEVAAPADAHPQANEAAKELVLMSSVVIGGYELNVFDRLGAGGDIASSWRHHVLASPDRVYWDHSGGGSPSLIFLKESSGAGGNDQKKADRVVLTAQRHPKLGVYWALDGQRTKAAESPDLEIAAMRIDNDLEKQKNFLASDFGENLSARYHSTLKLGDKLIRVAMDMESEVCGIEHIWRKHVVANAQGGARFKAELFGGDKNKVKELANEILAGFTSVYLQKDGKLIVIKEFQSMIGLDDDRPVQNIAAVLSPQQDGKRFFYSLTTMRPVVDHVLVSSDTMRIDLPGLEQEQFFTHEFVQSTIVSELERSFLAGQSKTNHRGDLQAASATTPKAAGPGDGYLVTDFIFGDYGDAGSSSEWLVVPQEKSVGGKADNLTNDVVSTTSEGM